MNSEEEQAAAKVFKDYKDTLSDLKTINKIQINVLTMVAEENKQFAIQIAACIENQLKIVSNSRKLPILYLIDSICKNYPHSVYVQLFTQNIVSNFCKVFEVSNEIVRKSLHKLKMTWNTTGIFPIKKLNAIDERVHKMDPNWPLMHKTLPGTAQQNHQPPPQPQARQSPMNPSTSDSDNNNSTTRVNNNNHQSNGRRKRPKLATNRNSHQTEPAIVAHPQAFIDPSIIQGPHELPQFLPTNFMDPSITIASNDQLHQTPFIDPSLIITSNEPQLATAPQLLCTSYNQVPSQLKTHEPQPPHLNVLESLYGGKQCSNCSLRFDDNVRYAIHLDWHYRQNLKSDNMFARRKWYYPLNLWVQFREINDDDLQDNNNAESNVNELSLPVNDHEVPTAPASKDDEKNICSVCHETFEKFWAEEDEEWRLKNAKLYEDESVYHPLCLMDMLQANGEAAT